MHKITCKTTSLLLRGLKHLPQAESRCFSGGHNPRSKATLPECNFVPESYNGASYEETLQTRSEHVSPGYLTYYKRPLLIHQGHMQWLYDHQGRRYLDMFGGIVTVSVGHCHPKVTKALQLQADKLWHTTNIYLHPGIHEYAKQLTSKLPEHLKVVYFVNSGSEANDMAMTLARLYTGSFDIVSLRNAYHGASPHLNGLTALNTWRHPLPSGFGILNTMNADVFRGPWGGRNCRDSPIQTTRDCDCNSGDECSAGIKYADQLEDLLLHSAPKGGKLAAFFSEPIQGVGGSVQYPKNFLKRAYDIVHERGGLCVSDEVQTGFGRLGSHYWGFESHGVKPDIVTMAKGIGNGFPLAAVVTTPEIGACITKALHFNTYGGNPLACAVGSSVLQVIDEERLQENCAVVGTHLLKRLASLRDKYEVVGDVRGKGLMLGLELVSQKNSTQPLAANEVADIWEECKDRGVLLGKGGLYGTTLRFKPPMCITKDDADFTADVLDEVLERHQQAQK